MGASLFEYNPQTDASNPFGDGTGTPAPYASQDGATPLSEAHRSGFNAGEAGQSILQELVKSYGFRRDEASGDWGWDVGNIAKAFEESPFWTTVDYLTLAMPVAKWGMAAKTVASGASTAGKAYKAGEFVGKSAETLRGRFAQGLGFTEEFAKAVDVQMKHGVNRGLVTRAFGETGERFAQKFESRVARNPMADPEYAALIQKFGPDAADARGIVSAMRREEHAAKVMIEREAQRLMTRQGALSTEGQAKLTRSLVAGAAEEGVDDALYRDTFAFRAKIHEGLKDAGLISDEAYQKNLNKYFPRMYQELYGNGPHPSGVSKALGGSKTRLMARELTDEQATKLVSEGVVTQILDPRVGTAEIAKAAMNLSGVNFFQQLSKSALVRNQDQMLEHVGRLIGGADDVGTKAARAMYSPEQLGRLSTRMKMSNHLGGTVGPDGATHPGLTQEGIREIVETELGWRTVRDALQGAPEKYLKSFGDEALDLYIDPNVIDDVVGMAKMQTQLEGLPGQVLNMYKGALGVFKHSKTVLNPATHFRNMFGALVFHHLSVGGGGALTNGFWQKGLKALREVDGADHADLLKAGLLDSGLQREIREILSKEFEIGAGTGAASFWGTLFGKLPVIGEKMKAGVEKGVMTAEDLYRGVDELAKADAFIVQRNKWMKTGISRDEAIGRAYADVAKYQPMFAQASDFTNGLRHVVPFASFTTETLRVWKNVMQDKPHIAFFWNHAVESVSQITAGIAGFDEGDLAEAKKAMPGYQQGKKMMAWPGKVDGKPMFLDMSYMIPLANIGGIDTAKANFFDYALIDPFIANPFVSLATAVKTGENPFTQYEIEPRFTENQLGIDVNGDHARRAVGLAEYTASMMVPPIVPPGGAGLNLLELARGTKEGVTAEEMEQGVVRTVAANLMGFRLYEGDVRSQTNNVKREDRDFSEDMTRRWKRYQDAMSNNRIGRAEEQLSEIEELRRQRGYTPQATQDYIAGRVRELEPGKYRQLPTKQAEEILERSRKLGYTSEKDQHAMTAIAAMLQERRARQRGKSSGKTGTVKVKKFKPKRVTRRER